MSEVLLWVRPWKECVCQRGSSRGFGSWTGYRSGPRNLMIRPNSPKPQIGILLFTSKYNNVDTYFHGYVTVKLVNIFKIQQRNKLLFFSFCFPFCQLGQLVKVKTRNAKPIDYLSMFLEAVYQTKQNPSISPFQKPPRGAEFQLSQCLEQAATFIYSATTTLLHHSFL